MAEQPQSRFFRPSAQAGVLKSRVHAFRLDSRYAKMTITVFPNPNGVVYFPPNVGGLD